MKATHYMPMGEKATSCGRIGADYTTAIIECVDCLSCIASIKSNRKKARKLKDNELKRIMDKT